MWQVDGKPDIVWEGIAAANEILMFCQSSINFASSPAWDPTCRRHQDNLPVHEFRLALHFVKILYRGACFDAHGYALTP
jgi:hypothetical protein